MSLATAEKPPVTRAGDRDRDQIAPIAVEPGYPGFVDLGARVGFALEPFQRRIARLVFEGRREVLILLPRGQGKTCLQALVALHHLLTVEGAEIFCCASSRDQAKILYQYAARFARELDHPNVVHRHLELRWCPDPSEPTDFTRYLRVLPAEAPRLYGLTPSLMFLDEYQALTDDEVYVALSSALHKRPDAQLIETYRPCYARKARCGGPFAFGAPRCLRVEVRRGRSACLPITRSDGRLNSSSKEPSWIRTSRPMGGGYSTR